MIFETLLAAVFFLFRQEVVGVVVFVYWISAKLILSDDSLSPFLPFLLIGLMVLRLYDSYDTFMARKYLIGIPAVISVLFHFLFYKKKMRKGALTKGYLVLSLALALGGLFSLPPADYFSGASLYYAYGSGFGMLLLYSLLLPGVNPRGEYDIREQVAKTAFYCGIYILFMIAVQYLTNLDMIREGWRFSETQLSALGNNLSTMVLLTMPFLFYSSFKGGVRGTIAFAVGVLEGFAALLSLSRGGILFGSAMCLFLILYTLVKYREGRMRHLLVLGGIFLVAGTLFGIFRREFIELFRQGIVPADGKIRMIGVGVAVGAVAVTGCLYRLFTVTDRKRQRISAGVLLSLLLLGGVSFFLFFDRLEGLLVRADYYRGNMMIIAVRNFRRYPFFGTGIGYRGLRAIYPNKKGMFGCYHCLPVQIVGSLGLFGVAAYLFMFHERFASLKRCKDPSFAATVFFSYLGLLWISLVNPGIFCPLVYGLQITLQFIAAERTEDSGKNPEK